MSGWGGGRVREREGRKAEVMAGAKDDVVEGREGGGGVGI